MKMKKFFYLFSIVLAIVACNEPLVPEMQDIDGPMVTIDFEVQMPEAMLTKAMSDSPAITEVWVLEFGAAGYFKRWAQAVPISGHIVANGESNAKRYTVELPLSSSEQRFHIIANPPTTQTFTGMTESEVVNSLETSGSNCAFWQRIKVPNGIRGIKQNDGTYIPTDESKAYFESIPLIRNFAKVWVKSSSGSNTGKILQYALVNVPASGKVAPYDAVHHGFVSKYFKENISSLSFASLYDDPAQRYTPQDVQITDIATSVSVSDLTFKTPNSDDKYLYMYERPLPTADPTCVLVEIQGKGWYKIEILNEGKYVPFYRDFIYTINIDSIDGDGETTAQAALEGPAFGDVSASLETESMTTISDGNSTLTVGYTDKTVISSTVSTVSLPFEFTFPSDATGARVTVEIQDVSGAVTAVSAVSGTSGTVTVTLAGNTTSTLKKSVLVVTGHTNEYRDVYRKVYFRVVGGLAFKAGSITGGSTMLDPVTLTVELPEDLGSSLFPFTFLIEADDNSLSANEESLPVSVGISPISGRHTFWFTKTIAYSEYYDRSTKEYTTLVPCIFKRNKTVSGTTTIRVRDEAGRFAEKDYTL